MSFALIAHSGGACTGNQSPSVSIPNSGSLNTTGANLIVVAIFGDFNSGSSTLTDNFGNTYTLAKYEATGSGRDACIVYYCINPTVGASHTWSSSTAPYFDSYSVSAWSGVATGGFDQVNAGALAGNGTITTQQTGSITPTVNGELCLAFFGADDPACTGATPYAVDSGFTLVDSIIDVPGGLYGGCSAYLVQATAAAVNPTMTRSVATGSGFHSASVIVSFKPAAAGTVALAAMALSVSQARSAFAGSAALLGSSRASSRLGSALKVAMALSGAARGQSAVKATIAGALPLSAKGMARAALNGGAKFGVSFSSRGMGSSRAALGPLSGRVSLAGRTIGASFGRIIPPGAIALFGRALGMAMARAGISGRVPLAGSARAQSTGKGVTLLTLLLKGASTGAARTSAGMKATAALAASSKGMSFVRGSVVGRVLLVGISRGASYGQAVLGRIGQFVFLTGRTMGMSRIAAAFVLFGPSRRRAAAPSQNKTATVAAMNTLIIVPTEGRKTNAE